MDAITRFNQDHISQSIEQILVHTGQHYDKVMSDLFFRDLNIPKPDVDLEVGSLSTARQTAEVMLRMEPVLAEKKPDLVTVVGDVNSTVGAALTAVKMGIPVAHIEAGLRSRDRNMPEEINRLVTDTISDLLFTTSEEAGRNLLSENISEEKIHFVGNTMIDSLLQHREHARCPEFLSAQNVSRFVVMTLHRPSNVDDPATFNELVRVVDDLQKKIHVVFPVHPRTRKMAEKFDIWGRLEKMPNLLLSPPLGYLEFLYLLAQAEFVMTDSGGIQEETTALGVPCLTLRRNTERPETVEQGTNTLTGPDYVKIMETADQIFSGQGKTGKVPDKWDGCAAERIVKTLTEFLES